MWRGSSVPSNIAVPLTLYCPLFDVSSTQYARAVATPFTNSGLTGAGRCSFGGRITTWPCWASTSPLWLKPANSPPQKDRIMSKQG